MDPDITPIISDTTKHNVLTHWGRDEMDAIL